MALSQDGRSLLVAAGKQIANIFTGHGAKTTTSENTNSGEPSNKKPQKAAPKRRKTVAKQNAHSDLAYKPALLALKDKLQPLAATDGEKLADKILVKNIEAAIKQLAAEKYERHNGSREGWREAYQAVPAELKPSTIRPILIANLDSTRMDLCAIAMANFDIEALMAAIISGHAELKQIDYSCISTTTLRSSLQAIVGRRIGSERVTNTIVETFAQWINEQCQPHIDPAYAARWSVTAESLPESLKAESLRPILRANESDTDTRQLIDIALANYDFESLDNLIAGEVDRIEIVSDINPIETRVVDDKAGAATKLGQSLQLSAFGELSNRPITIVSNYDGEYPLTVAGYRRPKMGEINSIDNLIEELRAFENDYGECGFVPVCEEIRKIEAARAKLKGRWPKTDIPRELTVSATIYHNKLVFHTSEATAEALAEWIATHASIPIAPVILQRKTKA